jgi:DNA-binding response OmpR family regulator
MNRKKKVLIADDDFAVADVIKMILEDEGYTVSHMSNGKHILDLEDNLPDLLLLDIKFGKMNGEDICRQLRQDNFFDDMRIILISAVPDVAELAADACADDFISKPFNIDELLQKIEKNLLKTTE